MGPGMVTHICKASELTRNVLQVFLELERAVGRQSGELRFSTGLERLLRLTERVPACSALSVSHTVSFVRASVTRRCPRPGRVKISHARGERVGRGREEEKKIPDAVDASGENELGIDLPTGTSIFSVHVYARHATELLKARPPSRCLRGRAGDLSRNSRPL